MKTYKKATLLKSFQISKDIKCLQFRTENTKKHTPGQFYSIRIPDEDGTFVQREYSLSNVPNSDGLLEFGIQKVRNGIVSTYLSSMKEGEEVSLDGPTGKYFNWTGKNNNPLIFIAGGAGIVPFMSMLRLNISQKKKRKVLLIGSFRTKKHIPFYEELIKTKNEDPNFKLVLTLTREKNKKWNGDFGRIDSTFLNKFIDVLNQKPGEIFVCGRTSFVKDISEMLISINIPKEKIQGEYFG